MYNSELKNRFLAENAFSVSNSKGYLSVFDQIAVREAEFGKDACAMNDDEISIVASELLGVRQHSISRIRMLEAYINWCFEAGVPGARQWHSEIKLDNSEKIISTMVSGPKQLQLFLDAVFKPEDEMSLENTYRVFYWLAFAGVKEEDIWRMKKDQVDLNEMTVTVGEYKLPIYRYSVKAFRSCVALDSFVRNHPRTGEPTLYKRVEGDLLLRGERKNPSLRNFTTLTNRLIADAVKNGATSRSLNYRNTRLSGIFYSAHEDELAGMPVSFERFAEYDIEDGAVKDPNKKRRTLINNYKRDYEKWKSVFY